MAYRGKAWLLLQPNQFYLNSILFETHKKKQTGIVCDIDIPNTFPELNPIFVEVHDLSDSLREILTAFGQLRPDVGYTPGMASPVGMLMLHMTAPSDSFRVFTNLAMTETLYNFYTSNLVFIK